MPRQTEREPRPTGRQRRFSDLAQVLQLQEGIERPQREARALDQRERGDNLQAAVQLLGIGSRAQSDAAQLQLGKEQMAANTAATKGRTFADLMQTASQPGVPAGVLSAIEMQEPSFAAGNAKAKQAELGRAAGVLEPQVKAVYGSGMAPGKMGPLLEALKMTNPEAFNSLDWNALNASLELESTPQPAGPGILDDREGGVLTPALNALNAPGTPGAPLTPQYNKQNQYPDMLEVLFGKKKKTQPR